MISFGILIFRGEMLNEVMKLRMAAPLMAVIIPSGWFHSGLQPSATS